MISSMTAFARNSEEYIWGNATWEVRSVNHRYLDAHFKMDEQDAHLEHTLKSRLKSYLSRGKVECHLKLNLNHGVVKEHTIDIHAVKHLLQQCETVGMHFRRYSAPSTLDILKWPGILHEKSRDTSEQFEQITSLFQKTLLDLVDARKREGSELATFINSRVENVLTIVEAIEKEYPHFLVKVQEKLRQKVELISQEHNQERLEQELAIIANKADIFEEVERIKTHGKEIKRILNEGGTCGRRLDFLMQELNREANTLSAKSISSSISSAAIELKVLIEQMREQVQNIE